VDSMNEFFGRQLRQELIDLMGRSGFLRARAASTGSQRLSLDSVGDLDEGDPQSTLSAKLFGRVELARLAVSWKVQPSCMECY